MTAPVPRRRRQSQVQLYTDLQGVADEQRRRLARRLHNSAQQSLAAASMSLSLLERQSADFSPAARQILTETMRVVATCNQELREISHALYPPLLEGMGLVPALRGLASRLGMHRVGLTIQPLPPVEPARALTIYLLIEEALEQAFAPDGVVDVHLRPLPPMVTGGALGVSLSGDAAGELVANPVISRLRLRTTVGGGQLRVRQTAGRLRLDVRFAHTSAIK